MGKLAARSHEIKDYFKQRLPENESQTSLKVDRASNDTNIESLHEETLNRKRIMALSVIYAISFIVAVLIIMS